MRAIIGFCGQLAERGKWPIRPSGDSELAYDVALYGHHAACHQRGACQGIALDTSQLVHRASYTCVWERVSCCGKLSWTSSNAMQLPLYPLLSEHTSGTSLNRTGMQNLLDMFCSVKLSLRIGEYHCQLMNLQTVSRMISPETGGL